MPQYRHEWKTEISQTDKLLLMQRLGAVMRRDPHVGADGTYQIRSLYFDDCRDTALNEKLDGLNVREKFRIRAYNKDLDLIKLEKKCKRNSLGYKLTAPLTQEQTAAIIAGDIDWMEQSEYPLVRDLRDSMLHRALEPKTIVAYTRIPFIYDAGNVRVTLDFDIRTGIRNTDFLNPDAVTVPASDICLLEVKYDNFLPDIIRDAVQLGSRRVGSFSKYAACRLYG